VEAITRTEETGEENGLNAHQLMRQRNPPEGGFSIGGRMTISWIESGLHIEPDNKGELGSSSTPCFRKLSIFNRLQF